MQTSTLSKTKWSIDPMHSEIEFKVKHLMISTVTGKFEKFHAEAESENEDLTNASIRFEAEVNSINTGNSQRDEHLKSDDFFNASLYPKLSFISNEFIKISDTVYKLKGMLSIREVSKEIELLVQYNGTITDFYGNIKAGFEITGKINRKDFNLKWSATTEAGGIVVSDEVKIIANIQMIKEK